jgi:hypothetical protein
MNEKIDKFEHKGVWVRVYYLLQYVMKGFIIWMKMLGMILYLNL